MKNNDNLLQRRFVQAIDEVIPPAPWLESRVIDAVRHQPRRGRRAFGLDTTIIFGRRLGGAAQLVALLLVAALIATLLISAHLRTQPVPVRKGNPVPSASPIQAEVPWNPPDSAFTPTYVRSPSWPPGGPVPANLAGAWQPTVHQLKSGVLELGGYSFLIMIISGNVVVNGSEIDFIVDWCGVDRYHYTLSGDTLALTRISAQCGFEFPRTYTRLPAGAMKNMESPSPA